MSENNKSYRIKTEVGRDKSVYFKLDQKFDILEILSLKLRQDGLYRLHTSDYGVIVGRVLANNGFGIPNAKVSVFIQISDDDIRRNEILGLYSFNTTRDKNADGIRYNLLPDTPVNECHKVVGTFPSKTMVLDNDIVLEVFDTYYKYTTKTNESGDYMIFGVPTGNQTVHVDLDLSDIGILSQRPRDFVYKGYTIEQFENPNQFKDGDDLSALSQVFSQDSMVEVIPFWGDENEGLVGISRNDVNIQFKFEPTCVFIGSVVSDNSSNGFSKKCVPTNSMGNMDELVTGNGTIEMIRKKPDGSVEEFQIQGNQLINGNGVWCYQIPMNLDYMKTDEYGNMVPTNNPEEGIPTRARVRFRISMQDFEQNVSNYFRAKVLVPHNPQDQSEVDYNFGSATLDSSYRDIFWNNVYTVKSYIPRLQKARGIRTERFSGIKHCNIHGQNNPIPYNNIRIRLPFMFTIICAIIKAYIWIINMTNKVIGYLPGLGAWSKGDRDCVYIGDSLCPDLEGWYFAPGCSSKKKSTIFFDKEGFKNDFWTFKWIGIREFTMLSNTYNQIVNNSNENIDGDTGISSNVNDKYSTDIKNRETGNNSSVCLTVHIDYLIQCIEINLAQEYKVIQFDFYNDWINGLIYIPRWMRFVRKKRNYLFGLIKIKAKVKGCMTDTSIFQKDRYLVQQCSLNYAWDSTNSGYTTLNATQKPGCHNKINKQKCHKKVGRNMVKVFGSNGGLVEERNTMYDQKVYYFKPCEWGNLKKINFFATDLCLLGSLNDCDLFGIPQAFKTLTSSSYQMPTNLALTNMEEDGYMYSQGDSGTICGSGNRYNADEKVTVAENSFSGAKKHNPEYVYIGNDDAVPLTESSGIDWGYTGPGQGDPIFDGSSIYLPGGHFLGLSCSQAETNIKSCINLGRICEHGVGMSQRVLVPKSYDENTDVWSYTNIIPNGFISQDEIFDHDFRMMFATMNYNNLKTKRDEKTGYLKYDFMVSMPTNFDGSFKKYAGKYGSNYNVSSNKIKIDDGIYVSLTQDDTEDATNGIVRSLENGNYDYYRFRFGITGDSSASLDKKYFLLTNGTNISMPVYENSYYFYFGLTDGATALDEFKKQFFSTCVNDQNNVKKLSLSTASFTVVEENGEFKRKEDYNIRDFIENRVQVVIKVNGGTMPYHFIIADENGLKLYERKNQNVKSFGIKLGLEEDKENEIYKIGKYKITVTDAEENTVTSLYNLGIDSIFSLNLNAHDYCIPLNSVNRGSNCQNCDEYGGYISWDGNLSMLGKDLGQRTELNPKPWEVCGKYFKKGTPNGIEMAEGKTSDGLIAFYPQDGDEGMFFAIHLQIGLFENGEFKYRDFIYGNNFNIETVKETDYWIGCDSFSYSTIKNYPTNNWYVTLSSDEKWKYRHYFTRQDRSDGLTIDTGITNKTQYLYNYIAGSPEKINSIDEITGEISAEIQQMYKTKSCINGLQEKYEGYDLSLNKVYLPTKSGEKQEYQFIVYDSRGQYALGKDITNGGISNLKVDNIGTLSSSNLSGLKQGYRYLISNKNISFTAYAAGGTNGRSDANRLITEEIGNLYEIKDILEGVPTKIFEFHSFPVFYKPFYFKIFAWSVGDSLSKNIDVFKKGYIYNGITYGGKFSKILCNGENITDLVKLTQPSDTDDISSSDRKLDISDSLKFNEFTYTTGNANFSCTEGTYDNSKFDLVKRECDLTYKFRQNIKVTKNEKTGLLTVSVSGDSEGVSYYAVNAKASSVKSRKLNRLSFPCNTSDSKNWKWNSSDIFLNPYSKVSRNVTDIETGESTTVQYYISDWLTTSSLSKMDSSFKRQDFNEIPTQLQGSYIENVTNQIGENNILRLTHAENVSDAYILGVADMETSDGSSICMYRVYDVFQTSSLFHGTYLFSTPEFDAANKRLNIIITVSNKDTWNAIHGVDVKMRCVINGDMTYVATDGNGETNRYQIVIENIELTKEKEVDNNNGGVLYYYYNGSHVKYKNFSMKGNTSLIVSKPIQTSTGPDGSALMSEVSEQFNSDNSWSVLGEQLLTPEEYVWEFSVLGQNENGHLKLSIETTPLYSQMTGNPADSLSFIFDVNDGEEKRVSIKLEGRRNISQTFTNINFNTITSISGFINGNLNSKMYKYNNKVILS